MSQYTVALMACPHYDNQAVATAIDEAVQAIVPEERPRGRVVIKPNLVMAHPKIATEGYTRPEVIHGIVDWVKTHDSISGIDIVEKSGLGITTAGAFRWAGYRKLKSLGVNLCAMEERPRQTVVLKHGRVHTHIDIACEMAQRDYLIFAPKLKTNVLSQGLTGAIKLNVGSVDSRERIAFHDHRLPQKMVDILEAINPDLIVTDGIRFSYGGNQMTQTGTHMGVVIVADNVVAHDMVAARLIGLDPMKIDHIQEAVQRGYGPSHPDEISITGDFDINRGVQVAAGLDFGFKPVQEASGPMKIICGSPYCIGGCQGIFLDWLHMLKDRRSIIPMKLPAITTVIGKPDHPVKASTVLLVGDCARAATGIEARRTVRIKGCPPTHKRIIWDMMVRFGRLAPLVRPSLIWDGFILYPLKRLKGWWVNR